MVVVFTGYNQRAVIAFLRSMEECGMKNYTLIASSPKDPILNTKYKEKVFAIRKKRELDKNEIISIIDNILNEYKISNVLIAPSTEALNRFLLDERECLVAHGCIIPLVKKELYITISDKTDFWNLCRLNDIKVPEILNIESVFKESYVAKPKKYVSKAGAIYSPIIVKNKSEHTHFLSNYDVSDFDIQEYVDGESYYLLYYFDKNYCAHKFSQVNYAQQPHGKSILAAECSEIHNDIISAQYVKLLTELKYHGFIMIELRKRSDQYYMIEANPRFWGPSQLYHDAGVSFFEMFLRDYGYIDHVTDKKINMSRKYFWLGGFNSKSIENSDCVWFGDGENYVLSNYNEFFNSEIYNRVDTIKLFNKEV